MLLCGDWLPPALVDRQWCAPGVLSLQLEKINTVDGSVGKLEGTVSELATSVAALTASLATVGRGRAVNVVVIPISSPRGNVWWF